MKTCKNTLLVLLLAAASCTAGCSKNEFDELDGPIKEVAEEMGVFYFDTDSKRPTVSVHTPGTIDVVDVYFIVNPPAVLPKKDDRVSITGTAKPSTLLARFGGYTNYELKLEKMVILE